MIFVLRMAWRETRGSWARLAFFFACLAVGVAAIVVLRSVVSSVRTTLTRESRSLVGADLVVQSPRPWTPDQLQTLAPLLATPDVLARTEVVETQTMTRAEEGKGTGIVRLVEVRAVEDAFPLYGTIELAGGQPYSPDLVHNRGVLVQPELLLDLGVAPGDSLVIAGQPFVIRGVVARDRVQKGSGIAFGPRIYISLADLRRTTLIGFGSRATFGLFLRVAEDAVTPLSATLRTTFRQQTVGVRSWRTLEDRLGRNLRTAENYLSLVGFAIVVLGGIGVWSVTRVIVQQRVRSVAILKTLGASSTRVVLTYVVQVSWLAIGGGIIGVALAYVAVWFVPARVLTALGLTSVTITASAAAQGAAVGVLVALMFAFLPLLEMKDVKPLLLLRADQPPGSRRRSWMSVGASVLIGALLIGVAAWQAGSLRAGLYVCGGLAACAFALALAGRVVVRATAPVTRSRSFALRHAALGLGRPGNQTRVILMAVGLGTLFVLTVRSVQANLLAEFGEESSRGFPDLVLLDVQKDQVDPVRAIAAGFSRQAPTLLPQLRARVLAVHGRSVTLTNRDEVREQRSIAREYSLTYRNELQRNETLVAGRFWKDPLTGNAEGADTEVSIETDVHTEAGIGLGDEIQFDIGGQRLRTRVTSIRKVAWNDEQNGGFVFVLRPGPAVDRLPHGFMGFVQLTADPRARADLQRQLVTAHPNVTVIDVRDILARVREVIDNASLAVTVVGGVFLVAGALILTGAVAMTKYQRVYETAIYRTLGASARLVATMTAIEYGLLGLLAGLVGAAGAFGLSWLLARYLFDIDWRPAPGLLAGGVLITAVAVGLIGFLATADVLLRKPLATLRGS